MLEAENARDRMLETENACARKREWKTAYAHIYTEFL